MSSIVGPGLGCNICICNGQNQTKRNLNRIDEAVFRSCMYKECLSRILFPLLLIFKGTKKIKTNLPIRNICGLVLNEFDAQHVPYVIDDARYCEINLR